MRSGGSTVGRLPFVAKRQFGFVTIGMPTLTHFLGPALADGDGSASTRQLRGISTTLALIAQLPRVSGFWMKCHRGITDTLAFQRAGYHTEVQFTCEIPPAPEPALWAGLRATERRVIRRAADALEVREEPDPDRFIAFYESNVRARGLHSTYGSAQCRAVMRACLEREAGRVLMAVDTAGQPSAGIFTIWDDTAEYYLMTTRRPNAHNGATGLLIWAAMRHAAANGRIFDLDGISTFGDMQFLTRFGGVLRPRYIVYRSSMPLRIAKRVGGSVGELVRPSAGARHRDT